MSEKELRDLLRALDDVAAENTTSAEKAREFLRKLGVLTPSGELTEPYRQP